MICIVLKLKVRLVPVVSLLFRNRCEISLKIIAVRRNFTIK